MNKRYPDNPIVGILAKAIKQDWVKQTSRTELKENQDDVNELRCRLQEQEEKICSLERQVEYLMRSVEYLMEKIHTEENSTQKDRKGIKKAKIPYPTTYIGTQPINIDTDTDVRSDTQSVKNESE